MDDGTDELARDEQFAAVAARFGLAGRARDDTSVAASETVGDEMQTQLQKQTSDRPRRKRARVSLAAVKAVAPRPELVELEDATAPDPALLAALRAAPHTAPVPRHWAVRRRYMSGRRPPAGRAPLALPAYIVDTGVPAARAARLAQDAGRTAKVRARAQRLAKTGGDSVDYGALHAAFFKHAFKPALTGHADLYWDGRPALGYAAAGAPGGALRPGVLGPELRAALGMGPDALAPPPWLHAMQRLGPPPAYPGLRVPGVTAPAPRGAVLGFQAGGWGRPPAAGTESLRPAPRADSFRWGAVAAD